jgi:hypothetical protein
LGQAQPFARMRKKLCIDNLSAFRSLNRVMIIHDVFLSGF